MRLFCVRQVASRRSARPLSLPFAAAASARCAHCAVKKSVASETRSREEINIIDDEIVVVVADVALVAVVVAVVASAALP